MNPFLFRRIRGPVFLLCFALTAILAQWGILSFASSWPIYLIAAGLLRLLDALVPVNSLQGGTFNAQGFPLVSPMRPVRRGSLTLALSELLVGIVALLITTNVLALANFWHIYATWWPLLLIAIGVLLLIERVFDRRADRGGYGNGSMYLPRRRRSGGLVLLVLLLIGLGLIGRANPFMATDSWRWQPDWNWALTSETHENDTHFEQHIPADGALTIDNARGDLQIAPSSDGMIHLDAHQVAHVPDREKDKAFAASTPVLEVHGASASITVPARNGVEVRLVVAVPDGVLCTLRNHHGDIAVSGLKRALEINQDHGDVALDSLGGAVHLTMDHGDVHARSLASDLIVDGHADDVTASDIQGKTSLKGEFFGDTQLDGIKGPVAFHSNRTDLDAERLTGQLSLDSGDMKISGASGGLRLKTRSKDVEITDLAGDAQISDNNGDITVAAKKPLGALNIENSTGDIILSVPQGASFSIHGQTGEDDDLSSEFPLQQSTGGGRKTFTAEVGQGGPHLEVSTSHGDLTLRHSSLEAPEKPEAPEAPEKPERPGKGSHHVRTLELKGEPPSTVVQ